jgi:hypothetical protein
VTTDLAPYKPPAAKQLNGPAFEVACGEFEAALRAIGGEPPPVKILHAVVRRTIRGYLAELEQPESRKNYGRFSQQTLALGNMAVGDVLGFRPPAANQVWANRMTTLRRLKDSPGLRFQIRQRAGFTEITRLPDFAYPSRNHADNPKAAWLATLGIDERKLAPAALGFGRRLDSNVKIAARKLMGKPTANWSRETTNKGLRITRTA